MKAQGRCVERERWRNGVIGATLIVVVASLVFASQASAWSSNTWHSPTGNIRCKFTRSVRVVACGVLNEGATIYLGINGKPRIAYDDAVYDIPAGPALPYGSYWSAVGFRCTSFSDRMQCVGVYSDHGFWLNRTNYRTW
jgi:hypothetical protein